MIKRLTKQQRNRLERLANSFSDISMAIQELKIVESERDEAQHAARKINGLVSPSQRVANIDVWPWLADK